MIVLPLPFFLSALMLAVSTFARSFKEAQGYSGVLVLLPVFPGVVSSLYPFTNRPWMAPLPILGKYSLAADVLSGKPPGLALYVLAAASAIACALLLVVLVARLLEREEIIYGR